MSHKRSDSSISEHTEMQMIPTVRENIKVGEIPIYINPKFIDSNEPELEKESSHHSLADSGKNLIINPKNQSVKSLQPEKQRNSRNSIKNGLIENTKIPTFIYKRFKSKIILLIEIIIFLGFFYCSFPYSSERSYFDLGLNIFCLIKIIIFHTCVYLDRNRKQEKFQLCKNQNQPLKQPFLIYINKLEEHELLQIWSIILTPISFVFQQYIFVQSLLLALKVPRLFFIVFIVRKKVHFLRKNVLLHMFKLAVFVLLFFLVFSVILGMFLGNLTNFYCINQTQLISITKGEAVEMSGLSICGLSTQCGEGLSCLNVFEYAQNQADMERIKNVLGEGDGISHFDGTILNSYLAASSVGFSLYEKYSELSSSVLVYLVVLFFWGLSTLAMGIQVGEVLRNETLQDWHLNRLECKGGSRRDRNLSNISFNPYKVKIQSSPNIAPQEDEKQQFLQLTQDIERIEKQLKERPFTQKILTVVFNAFCISHISLIILDDLELGSQDNSVFNSVLMFFTCCWLIAVIVALIQFRSEEEQDSIKKFILVYEIFGLIVTILDYVARSQDDGHYLERKSLLTPISHAIISLRIMFVMFNNGFSAYLSFYTEKMIRNTYNSSRFLAIVLLLGVVIGFAEMNLRTQSITDIQTLSIINNTMSMIIGTGGKYETNILGSVFFAILKIIGFIINLYIAKHYNLGYDAIFNVDLEEQDQVFVQFPESIRQINSLRIFSPFNCFRQLCFKIHSSEYYHYLKIVIVLTYTIISLIYNPRQSQGTLVIILFCVDIYFLLDVFTQIVAYGMRGQESYMNNLPFFKIMHIVCQFFLLITVFVPHNLPVSLIVLIRATKLWVLFQYIEVLRKGINTIHTILLHPKLQLYKVLLMAFPLCVLGMCLTARYAAESDNKLYDCLINGVTFAFGLGIGFSSSQVSQPQTSLLSLNIMFLIVVLFYHVLFTFIMVTYFVNLKVRQMGDIESQIVAKYSSTDPDSYDHIGSHDHSISNYLKYLKLTLLGVSFVCLCLLVGDLFPFPEMRVPIALINLFIALAELGIYIVENFLVKTHGKQKWPLSEGIFILFSIPGSFLLIIPTSRYSSANLSMITVIRVLLMFSALKLFNIFRLITNRSCKHLTSRIWRRILSNVFFQEYFCLALLCALLLLPFAVATSIENQTSLSEQFLAFLSGAFFRNSVSSLYDFIVKLFALSLIFTPLKTMMIARIISSFLTNKPNSLTILHEDICEVIANNGVLDRNQASLHVRCNNYYKIVKKLGEVFNSIAFSKVDVYNYKGVQSIVKQIKNPLFIFQQNKKKKKFNHQMYGLFIFDIINGILNLTELNQSKRTNSLYASIQQNPQLISKTQLNSHDLPVLIRCKNKLKSALNCRMIKKKKEKQEDNKKSYRSHID